MADTSHFVANSFYGKSKRYLNPLERKQIKDLKGTTLNEEVIPAKKTPPQKKKTLPNIKSSKASLLRTCKSSPVTAKLNSDPVSEIVLYKTNKPSPNKGMNRKFFHKHSPTKSPRKAQMTLDMGRSLQLKFSNVKQSPRKVNKTALILTHPTFPGVRRSPRKKNNTVLNLTEQTLTNNDVSLENNNMIVQKTHVDITESDNESGFSEDGSSTFSATSTPPRTKLISTPNMTPSPKHANSPKLKSTKCRFQLLAKTKKGNLEQLAIDAGQKDFGAVRCQTCNMVYTTRDPHDEIAHSRFHNMFVNTLRFPGWKKEELIKDFYDGRIIRVLPNMAKHQLQKVEELRQLIDTNLGFPNVGLMNPTETHFYLFIATDIKKIVGCIIAEPITKAFRVFQDPQATKGNIWCRAETPVPAFCGISRIWIHSSHRRKRIASRLVDSVSLNFAYGSVIRKEQIAFSDPTPDGREFISAYAGTSSFLVYGGY